MTGQETFDQNPEIIPFEGYLTRANEAYSKEEIMVAEEPKETKRGFWSKFYTFLTMGGFMLVLIAIVAIIFVVSILTAKPDKGVTIVSPKANDIVKAEDSYEILWKSEPAEPEFGTMVTVEFSTNAGKSWQNVGENVPNTGKYIWKVPKVDSTHCKIRVFSQLRSKYRGTSKVFSVK